MADIEIPKRSRSTAKLILSAVILGIFAAAAFYIYKYGVPGPLSGAGSLFSQTLRDTLSFGTDRKLVAEIDLTRQAMSGEQHTSSTDITPPAVSHEENGPLSPERPSRKNKHLDAVALVATSTFDSASSGLVSVEKVSAGDDAPPVCGFETNAEPNHKVILNEIAWMGSPPQGGETAAQASQREWLELKNNFGQDIDLSRWQILNKSGKFKVIFGGGEKLNAGEFYLLERGDDDSMPKIPADKIFSGSLSNSGEWLRIFDGDCVLSDELDASSGWRGGDNGTKQTIERNVTNLGWHTSASPGGTPKMANSNVVEDEPLAIVSPTVQTGSQSAVVVSATSSEDTNQSQATTTAQNNPALAHLLIGAIQIAAASSTNDFIKIFNQTASAIDVGGWKLRKRTSSGGEYSVRVFPAGSSIAPSAYFVWANSAGGFSASIAANVSSTETLSADNSAALLDASGTIVDKVAWGEGVNQFVEGSAYAVNPPANQILLRKSAAGVMQDTDDNAADFSIQ